MHTKSKHLAIAGIIAAISFLLTFIEFPIFPTVGFLKFDPSDSLIALLMLLFGWIPSFFALCVKSILFLFTNRSGGVIGILMNFVAGLAYLTGLHFVRNALNKNKNILAIFYYGFTSLIIGIVMCLMNYFVALPFYLNDINSLADVGFQLEKQYFIALDKYFYFLIAFNFIKFSIDSIIGHLIYKRTKNMI